MEQAINAALRAYDAHARAQFGPVAVWFAPVRYLGALLRDGLQTAVGFFLLVKAKVKRGSSL